MSNSSIWPADRTRSHATNTGYGRTGNDDNKGVLRIPQSSSISGASQSDCLVSYLGHSLGKSYPSAEMLLVYSTAPADGAKRWNGLSHNKWMQQTCTKRVHNLAQLAREDDPLGTVQEFKILQNNKMIHAQTNIRPREWVV